jgi:glutamate-1-semialdehyde 2,1-aminomutase
VLAEQDSLYAGLEERGNQLADGIREIMLRRNIPHLVQNVGPMLSIVLTKAAAESLSNYREVRLHADVEGYIEFQHALLDRGVYIHPNQFEPLYISTAHRKEDIGEALDRFDDAIRHLIHG